MLARAMISLKLCLLKLLIKTKKTPRLSLVFTGNHTVMEKYLKMNIKV